jgi:Fe-S cluster assembly protein SufB
MAINKAQPDIGDYKYGFSDDIKPVYKSQRGLSEKVIHHLSDIKNEPDWMRQYRLEAYQIFKE